MFKGELMFAKLKAFIGRPLKSGRGEDGHLLTKVQAFAHAHSDALTLRLLMDQSRLF